MRVEEETEGRALPRLYTAEEIADLCGVSVKTVHRWIGGGDLVAHRFGRLLRVSASDLEDFLDRCRRGR